MRIQPGKGIPENKYKMHKGNLNILIDEIEEFIENWYMAPAAVMGSLKQALTEAETFKRALSKKKSDE